MTKRKSCEVHYYLAPATAPNLPCPYPYCERGQMQNGIVVDGQKWLRESEGMESTQKLVGPTIMFRWGRVEDSEEGE